MIKKLCVKIILQADKHSFFWISDIPSFFFKLPKRKKKIKEIYHTLLRALFKDFFHIQGFNLNAMQFSFNLLWKEEIKKKSGYPRDKKINFNKI